MDVAEIFKGIFSPEQRTNGGPAGYARERYGRVIAQLAGHAVRWAAVASAGIRCTLQAPRAGGGVACGGAAASSCVCCHSPVCIEHAMISPTDGTMICFACVGQAVTSGKGDYQPPRPPPRKVDPVERAKHLEELELSDPVTPEEIKAAYKDLARQYHPDKASSEGTRRRYESRIKRINAAYQWLKEQEQS